MKCIRAFSLSVAAVVSGLAEVFATVMVALTLTATGTVEMRITSAISAMVEGLRGLEYPVVFAPAAHEVAAFMGRMPQWALVALALWGLYRALCAAHGHGLGRKAAETIKEASTVTSRAPAPAPATAKVARMPSATATGFTGAVSRPTSTITDFGPSAVSTLRAK